MPTKPVNETGMALDDRIVVMVPREIKQLFTAYCADKGVNPSVYLREVVAKAIDCKRK